jgi:hypothetical protein
MPALRLSVPLTQQIANLVARFDAAVKAAVVSCEPLNAAATVTVRHSPCLPVQRSSYVRKYIVFEFMDEFASGGALAGSAHCRTVSRGVNIVC